MVKSKDVFLFSTADWASPYWTNKQHMARLLRDRGYRVLYIESFGLRAPGGNRRDLGRLFRRLIRGLRPVSQVEPGIFVLSPLLFPWKHNWAVVKAYNSWFLRMRLKTFALLRGVRHPLLWTYHPFLRQVAEAFPQSQVVYHCVDDLGAVPGINTEALRDAEAELAPHCNAIFTTSLNLQTMMSALAPGRSHYFSNVADLQFFSQARLRSGRELPSDLARIPSPRIGYVGVLSDYKVDFELLLAVAEKRADWHWVLIGEEREGQNDPTLMRLRQLSNVHLLGYKSYGEIPAYLAGMDVATLPTRLNEYTRSMFPMKFFEYLAAGVPVVSTPLPALNEHHHLFSVAATSDEFISAIEVLLQQPKTQRAPALESLTGHDWDTRLSRMLDLV